MAVVVQCFHCNAVLELDEGFRGGVCRCSGCGSLLQVPKGERSPKGRRIRPAAPGSTPAAVEPTSPSTVPVADQPAPPPDQRSPRADRRPSVDASGLSSGLRQVHKTRPISTSSSKDNTKTVPEMPAAPLSATSPPALPRNVRQNNKLLWTSLILIGVIAVVVIVLLVSYVLRPEEQPPAAQQGLPTSQPAAREASFIGIPLTGRRIILSVDAAASMSDSFDYIRRGIARSAGRLADNQPILVTLWTNDGLKRLPASGFGKGEAFIKELTDSLQSAAPEGASDAEKCMQETLGLAGPGDQVIFITAKNPLPASLATTVLANRKDNVRVDGVKLVTQDTPSPLEAMAAASGGQYVFLVPSELDQATR